MARSMNKKYFGNRNIGTTSTTTDDGIGGEGVASVTVAGTFSGFADATTTVTFSDPQLPGGVTATGTAVIVAGVVTGITITEKGSGYTTAPTVTIADSDVGAETATGTLTAVLTTDSGPVGSSTNQENAIVAYAYIGGANKVADIISQKGARRFKVKTANGTEVCTLVTGGTASAEGEMTITATDSDGGAYWVKKIGNKRATVVAKGVGGGSQFATDSSIPWTFGSAVEGQSVKIANA